MASAATLRARVRTRLEETTAAVWTDEELDECVTGALEAYGWRFPTEAIATPAVIDGATTTPVPADTVSIRRVILADGTIVPRRRAPDRTTRNEEQAWEVYAGLLHFTQPLDAGTLTIWHSAAVTLDALPEADEGHVVLGAVVQALETRAIQDFKRGGSPTGDSVITTARDSFEHALTQRARRVRDGVVET